MSASISRIFRKLLTFMLAVVAMFSTSVTVAPLPHDYENEYAVVAEVYESGGGVVVFADESGKLWPAHTESSFSYDTEYILIVYNNGTPEEADDYVVSILAYRRPIY